MATGRWTAQISLGTTAGELEVMPKLNGQDAAANAAKVTVVADALSSGQSTVSVAEDHVKAGESTTVTLIAKDAHGNAISGLSLSASLTGAASEGATVSSWTEQGDGSYVATLTTGGKTGELRRHAAIQRPASSHRSRAVDGHRRRDVISELYACCGQ